MSGAVGTFAAAPRRGQTRVRASIDRAADELRASSRAFTAGNLFHAVLRASPLLFSGMTRARFAEGPLAERLGDGPIPGLLAASPARLPADMAADEWAAYFPAAILLVDRAEIVDLLAASGLLVQARVAIVALDGSPANIVSWLARGARKGRRAPVGYLHDARSIAYPFVCEPVASLVRAAGRRSIAYKDLGISHEGGLPDPLGIALSYSKKARELEEVPPASLAAYAARELSAMSPPDMMLAPIRPTTAAATKRIR